MCVLLINIYVQFLSRNSFIFHEKKKRKKIKGFEHRIQGNECVLVMNTRVCFLFTGHRVKWSWEVQKAA